MEVLSEHLCQGWLEGYLLTGRHGLFNCYEAFHPHIASMFNQARPSGSGPPAASRGRAPIASLNYHPWGPAPTTDDSPNRCTSRASRRYVPPSKYARQPQNLLAPHRPDLKLLGHHQRLPSTSWPPQNPDTEHPQGTSLTETLRRPCSLTDQAGDLTPTTAIPGWLHRPSPSTDAKTTTTTCTSVDLPIEEGTHH
jgi:hypothetical protein